MGSPLDAIAVNLFSSTTNPEPVKVLTLAEALDAIQNGTYRRPVQRLRGLLRAGDKAGYNRAKRRLDAITPGGTFSPSRAKIHLTLHSSIIHGDLDHLADVDTTKAHLADDPHVLYTFVSPSGGGLKMGVCIVPVADDTAYKHAWQAVADYYARLYGLTWDPSGKDICRLCYMSWDPDLYRNPEAPLFPVPEPAPRPNATPPSHRVPFDVPRDRRERFARQAIQTAVAMIDASTPGNRHHARLRASYLLGGYIGGGILREADAYAALAEAVARNTEHLEQSLKTVEDGLRDGQARPITLEELEAERRPGWTTTSGVTVLPAVSGALHR